MKDLYTFDYSAEGALKTYNAVREAYSAFFDDLKIPYIQAEADSGNMGGNLSHEFHIASAKGEDQIVSCSSCDYVSNEELAESGLRNKPPEELQKGENLDDSTPIDQLSTIYDAKDECRVWTGITSDELTLVNVYYPWDWGNADASTKYPFDSSDYSELNTHLLRKLVPGVDLSGPKSAISWRHKFEATRKGTESHDLRTVHIIDSRIPKPVQPSVPVYQREPLVAEEYVRTNPITGSPLNLKKIDAGDPCPRCADGKLETTTAIELGHTFFLGTRYSSVLGATVAVDPGRVDTPSELLEKPTSSSVMEDDGGKPLQAVTAKKTNSKSQKPESTTTSMVPLQMGCHGIGVSRMIAAVADCLADSTGLNWPRLIAPFEVVVVYSHGLEEAGTRIYDDLVTSKDATIDAILDDRAKSLPYKLTDADLIGYPVIVGVGKSWRERQHVEVQCRRLNVRKIVSPDGLPQYVESLLRQL
jgi:prolyl-tRNA synthetase